MATTALTIPSNFAEKKQEMAPFNMLSKSFDPLRKDMHDVVVNMTNYTSVRKEVFAKLLVFLDIMLEKMGLLVTYETKREKEETQRKKQEKVQDDNQVWWKKLFKAKWFDKVQRTLQDSLDKGAGFFGDLFKWLFAFALIGPDIILSIAKTIGGLLVWLIRMFASYIPKMVDTVIKVFLGMFPILWDVFKQIGLVIFDSIKSSVKKLFTFDPTEGIGKNLKAFSELFLEFGLILIVVSKSLKKFSTIFNLLQPLFDFLFGGIAKNGTKSISILQKMWKVWGSGLEKVFSLFNNFSFKILKAFSFLKNLSLANIFQKVISSFGKLKDILVSLRMNFSLVFGFISKRIGMVFNFIREGLIVIGTKISMFISNAFNILGKFGQALLQIGKSILSFIGNIFTFIGNAIRSFLTMIGPIGWIIIGITAAIALIWKFSDTIERWIDNTITTFMKWYDSLSSTGKFIVQLLAGIFFPITSAVLLLVGIVKGLARFFNMIKVFGFEDTISMIWNSIKEFFSTLGEKISKWIGDSFITLRDTIKTGWYSMLDFLSAGITWLVNKAKGIFSIGGYQATFQQLVAEQQVSRQFNVSTERILEIAKTGQANVSSPAEMAVLGQLQSEGVSKGLSDERIYAALEKIAANTKENTKAELLINEAPYNKTGKRIMGGT